MLRHSHGPQAACRFR